MSPDNHVLDDASASDVWKKDAPWPRDEGDVIWSECSNVVACLNYAGNALDRVERSYVAASEYDIVVWEWYKVLHCRAAMGYAIKRWDRILDSELVHSNWPPSGCNSPRRWKQLRTSDLIDEYLIMKDFSQVVETVAKSIVLTRQVGWYRMYFCRGRSFEYPFNSCSF